MTSTESNLWTTLRTHAVFRVATVYAIAGWLLIQFADISLEAFDAPESLMQGVLILVLAGFPITLIASWLLNRSTLDGTTNTIVTLTTLALAVFVSSAMFIFLGEDTSVTEEQEIVDDATVRDSNPVIAILPFSNLSSDSENEYLADGMVEDIITLLAQSPGVEVVARNSTFKYKNTNPDIRDVGRDLNADYVIEGSIRPVGERLRVTIQVIDALTGSHVWAEKYDESIDDFFALQDEISLGIAAAVGDAVFRTEYLAINQSRTDNLSAWALTSQAEVRMHAPTFGIDDLEIARQAIELDQNYALAYAVLARSLSLHTLFFSNEKLEQNANLEEAERLARHAEQLAPNDPKVQAYLAITLLWVGKPEEALRVSAQLPSMSPSYAEGLAYHGDILIHNGKPAEGIPHLEKAIRLTPQAGQLGIYCNMLSEAYVHLGKWSQAEHWLHEAIRHYGGINAFAEAHLAGVSLQLGKTEQARQAIKRNREIGIQSLDRVIDVMYFYAADDGGDNYQKMFNDLLEFDENLGSN